MIFGGLVNPFQLRDLWQQFPQKASFLEQFEAAARGAFGEQLAELIADAFGRDRMNFRRIFSDGRKGFWIKGVTKARGEAHRTQHAKPVFGETAIGFADRANNPTEEVGATADVVQDFTGRVLHEQAVDREVAARNIFLGGTSKDDL